MNDHTQYVRRKLRTPFTVASSTLNQQHSLSPARVRRYNHANNKAVHEKGEQQWKKEKRSSSAGVKGLQVRE